MTVLCPWARHVVRCLVLWLNPGRRIQTWLKNCWLGCKEANQTNKNWREFYAQVCFFAILVTDIGSCSQWQKVSFSPSIKVKASQFMEQKKISAIYYILAAQCHSKLYLCIPNFEIGLLVNQIFDFMFNLIIIWREFSRFCTERCRKFQILGVRSCSQNGEKKLWYQLIFHIYCRYFGFYGIHSNKGSVCAIMCRLPMQTKTMIKKNRPCPTGCVSMGV